MMNPFDDGDEPKQSSIRQPYAAYTRSSSPAKRYQPLDYDSEEDTTEDFVGFPASEIKQNRESIKQSPNIFSRSTGRANQQGRHAKSPFVGNAPNLEFDPHMDSETTPRAHYTSRESPKRQRNTEVLIDDADDDDIKNSGSPFRSSFKGSTISSQRYLDPPEPIFTPGTLYDAGNYADGHYADDQSTYYEDDKKFDTDGTKEETRTMQNPCILSPLHTLDTHIYPILTMKHNILPNQLMAT